MFPAPGPHVLEPGLSPPPIGNKSATHRCMPNLTDEQRRALQLLASSVNGYTEALLMAHGFANEMLGHLVLDGLAEAMLKDTRTGGRQTFVLWMQITEEGRKAIN
jgi:hypothetical protein